MAGLEPALSGSRSRRTSKLSHTLNSSRGDLFLRFDAPNPCRPICDGGLAADRVFPATIRPVVRPTRRQNMNQCVSRSHVRQDVGGFPEIPHALANVATIQTNKKSPMSV